MSGEVWAATFSETAHAYAATMAPALRPIAAEVVRRAALSPGERVLDVGTGTGIGAQAALRHQVSVSGLDVAPGMLAIARQELPPEVELFEADLAQMPFDDRSFDALISIHVLMFAPDPVAGLVEMRRVTRPGGRLSLSVPGPEEATLQPLFGPVDQRHGVPPSPRILPNGEDVRQWAEAAGWQEIEVAEDPSNVIPLADEEAFRLWTQVGPRRLATQALSEERREALTVALMAASPRAGDGGFAIPFGCIYLTASL